MSIFTIRVTESGQHVHITPTRTRSGLWGYAAIDDDGQPDNELVAPICANSRHECEDKIRKLFAHPCWVLQEEAELVEVSAAKHMELSRLYTRMAMGIMSADKIKAQSLIEEARYQLELAFAELIDDQA